MDRKFLFAMFLSFLTVWLVQYYMAEKQPTTGTVPEQVVPGQAYKVPTQQELSRPLNLEVDFIDKKVTQKEDIIQVATDYCVLSFSNFGGILSSIDFKEYTGKNNTFLRTVHKKSFYEREQTSFLLALEEKTPYFYNLINKEELDDKFVFAYQTEVNGWIIKKNYTVYKQSYRLDLDLIFEKKTKDKTISIRPRLFFAAPFVGEIEGNIQTAFCGDIKGGITKISAGKELEQAWVVPPIFGAEDKYFAHCLIGDSSSFAQRAYFKKLGNNFLYPILEGPRIEENQSSSLSFYLGPKSLDELVATDQRLEALLSFGWLSWICRLFVKFLSYLYNLLGNYGIAIILLTLLVKIPFIPLSIFSRKKMELYSKHQPNINKIRMKYRNNINLQRLELMKYHKDHNLSHMTPIMGCLPLLIQIPILFSLYRVLSSYLDLYQAPFLGWITDLSSKDPYYVLPILMGASMFLQQKMSPMQDEKQRVMMLFMPLILTAIFIGLPSGLVLYMLANNLFTVAEDVFRKKYFK